MIEPSTGVSPDLISELIFFFLLYWEVRLNWPSESLFSPSLTQLYCLEFVAELEGTISEGGDEAFFKETLCSCCMCFCSYICRILLHSCRKEICHALDTKRINFKRHSTYLLRTWKQMHLNTMTMKDNIFREQWEVQGRTPKSSSNLRKGSRRMS